jgi:hypothetical protein
MPKSIEVKLAGASYTINELPSRKNMKWRESLRNEFGELVDVLAKAPGVEVDSAAGMAQIGELVRVLVGQVVGSVDVLRDHLFAYSPELQKKRDELEENGFDSEFIEAFVGVLRLAFPFGSLVDLATAAVKKAGQQTSRTS